MTRREAGYLLAEWNELTDSERALEVALRRATSIIEAVQFGKLETKK